MVIYGYYIVIYSINLNNVYPHSLQPMHPPPAPPNIPGLVSCHFYGFYETVLHLQNFSICLLRSLVTYRARIS
jgi:hypothetical protein